MSEQQPEETRGESGSVGAGSIFPASSETPAELAAAAAVAMNVLASPAIAPDHEAPKADEPKVEATKCEAAKTEPAKAEAPRIEIPKSNIPHATGEVLSMAPGDRAWHDHSAAARVEPVNPKLDAELRTPAAPHRAFARTAAMLAFATIAGAISGALATTGLTHVADAAATAPANGALEASIARIDADIVALKAGLEHTSKLSMTQFNKTSDRIEKIEKAQAEPNAKLAKLTEAVDRLRATPLAAPAPAQAAAAAPAASATAPKEVTGSVTTPPGAAPLPTAAAPASASQAKSDTGRPPRVEGWTLADVGYGGALIANRRGTFEVYAGDYIPGLGRIDAIRKQDGRWVVVTSKGLIVAR